jgi:uncharacterized protein YkwD
MNAAQGYAQYMADYNFFDHTGLDGSTPTTRINAQGFQWTSNGENIAAGGDSVSSTIDMWMHSDGKILFAVLFRRNNSDQLNRTPCQYLG